MDWPIPGRPWQGVFLLNFVWEVGMIADHATIPSLGFFIIFQIFCVPSFLIVYFAEGFFQGHLNKYHVPEFLGVSTRGKRPQDKKKKSRKQREN